MVNSPDVYKRQVDHDWTLRTLADKLPVSTTVMHRLLIGAYQAPTCLLYTSRCV